MVDRQPEPAPVCLLLFFPPADLENNGVNGICIANVDQQGNILSTVHDVRVTGFTVRGFPGVGIVFAGTSGIRADHNVAANNQSYGITAFASAHGRFEDNTVFGTSDAGLYMGTSPDADFTIKPAARLSAQFPRPLTYSPADADESSAYAHRPYQPLGLRAICQPHSEVMTT
jgi:Right handed beta helix region